MAYCARRSLAVALASVALAGPASAGEVLTPIARCLVDGTSIEMPVTADPSTGGWLIDNWYYSSAEVQITLSALLDPDPQIVYAASVIDFGAPSSFGFVFQQAIVPTPAPGSVSHSHSSSTTNGGGLDTPVGALPPPFGIPVDADGIPEISVYTVSTDGGGSFLNAGLDLSPSFTGAAPSDTQGAFNPAAIAGPAGAGFYDLMRIDINFSMDGGSDAYTFNGIAEVVPEPATALLLGLGLAGLGVARRTRRP